MNGTLTALLNAAIEQKKEAEMLEVIAKRANNKLKDIIAQIHDEGRVSNDWDSVQYYARQAGVVL